MIDWKTLKRNAGIITAVSLTSDLFMMGVQQLDGDGKIPGGARKVINIVGVSGVNAAWLIAPLVSQPRLRKPWDKVAKVLGATLMAGGACLGWSSTRDRKIIGVETPDSLVTRGLYGYMRHPTYAAIMAGSLGWSFFRGTPYSAAALPPLFAQILTGGLYEERIQLKPLFGEEYEAYRERTPFLPRPLVLLLIGLYLLSLCGMNESLLVRAGDQTGARLSIRP